MATRTNRNLTREQRRTNLEDVSLVWFSDDVVLAEIDPMLEDKLRVINDYFLVYTDETLLMDYIKSVRCEMIVLIISVSHQDPEVAIRLATSIGTAANIGAILLLTNNRSIKFTMNTCLKIAHVCYNEQELIEALEQNITMLQKQPVNLMDDFNTHQKFIRELDKESATFLYLHLFKDIVVNMLHDPAAKIAMLEQCRAYYADNRAQLACIDRFESTYQSADAVRWYTKDSFVYRLVNKALRTEDIEQLYLFRFYIADLCLHLQALKQEQQPHPIDKMSVTNTMVVYRGIRQSSNDLNTLRTNIGHTISINGFLSASRDERIALMFASAGTAPTGEQTHSVIWEIHIDLTLPDVTAADISHLSTHPEEREVLFDIGTTFRVDTLMYDKTHMLWRCTMTATNDGVQFVRDHISFYATEMQETSHDVRFGGLLVDMCAYSQATAYLQELLKNTDRLDAAHIHFHLGRICHFQSGYEQAMWHLHKALELECSPLNIARIMVEIGIQLYQRGDYVQHDDYVEGISWNERALELYANNGRAESSNAAYCLNNIGFGLNKSGNYIIALDFHMRALHMREHVLPRDHAFIAQSYRNVGLAYCELGDCDQALAYQMKALAIVERTVPDTHWSRANTLRNIGIIRHRQSDFLRAREQFEQALKIFEHAFGYDHPDISRTRAMVECARNGSSLPFW